MIRNFFEKTKKIATYYVALIVGESGIAAVMGHARAKSFVADEERTLSSCRVKEATTGKKTDEEAGPSDELPKLTALVLSIRPRLGLAVFRPKLDGQTSWDSFLFSFWTLFGLSATAECTADRQCDFVIRIA